MYNFSLKKMELTCAKAAINFVHSIAMPCFAQWKWNVEFWSISGLDIYFLQTRTHFLKFIYSKKEIQGCNSLLVFYLFRFQTSHGYFFFLCISHYLLSRNEFCCRMIDIQLSISTYWVINTYFCSYLLTLLLVGYYSPFWWFQ